MFYPFWSIKNHFFLIRTFDRAIVDLSMLLRVSSKLYCALRNIFNFSFTLLSNLTENYWNVHKNLQKDGFVLDFFIENMYTTYIKIG